MTITKKVINIINFVRATCLTDKNRDLILPVKEEIKLNKQYGFKNTFLLQYDAIISKDYQEIFLSEIDDNMELGLWFECVRPLVEAAGLKWRGKEDLIWDWHVKPGFLLAYTNKEKKLLIDEAIRKFNDVFGFAPASVGSWMLDSWSINYMKEEYNIKAFAICREQYGVDAYTLWGGYYNQGYYPSKYNVLCPGQSEENTIKAPVFRMLGADPIYCYDEHEFDTGITQGCATMEPVWEYGSSEKIVKGYFDSYYKEECMDFAYATVGQENSFGWDRIDKGLNLQYKLIDKMNKNGEVVLETLSETGEWFKNTFEKNPTVSLISREDWADNGIKSVWFSCPNYRANLLLHGNQLYFRDINKFEEMYKDRYFSQPCDTWNAIYDNLPIVDSRLWSDESLKSGLKLDANVKGLTTERLYDKLICTAESEEGDIIITFSTDAIFIKKPSAVKIWFERAKEFDTKLEVDENTLRLEHNKYAYSVKFNVPITETEKGYMIEGEETEIIIFFT